MFISETLKKEILERFNGKKIAVLYGGLNEEREVSLRSGQNVYNALKSFNELRENCILIDVKNGYDLVETLKKEKIEYCYNILHGTSGEDGTIQGMLETLGIKYTGENVLVSSICMNKIATKYIWKFCNIPTSDFSLLEDIIKIEDDLLITKNYPISFPVIVKPISSGSSVQVSLVKDKKDFLNILESIKDDKEKFFVEKYIKGTEITVGLVKENEGVYVFPILGIYSQNEIYDYEAKYTPNKTRFEIPVKISKEVENLVVKECSLAYTRLGCRGLCRIDAMIDEKGDLYLMEVNTQSGMTETSDIPAMAKYKEIDFNDLVLYILSLIER